MKRLNGTIVPAVFFLLILIAACGREQSMASKSAAAYRDALAKGTPVGGGEEHAGHAAETSAVTTTATKHGETTTDPHAGMDHGPADAPSAGHAGHATTQMSSSDHAAMGHSSGGTAHVGHTAASGVTPRHEGHAPAASGTAAGQHAGTQHGASGTATGQHAQHEQQPSTPQRAVDPHAQHGAAPAVRQAMTTAPEQAIQLSSTLRGDIFDAPAPIAVSEAAKAAQGGGHEGHQMRGITPGQDRENPPTPMPATRDQNRAGEPIDHSQHGSAGSTSSQKPVAAVLYACPMHPEVTSDKPGTCPKCGMALVKKN